MTFSLFWVGGGAGAWSVLRLMLGIDDPLHHGTYTARTHCSKYPTAPTPLTYTRTPAPLKYITATTPHQYYGACTGHHNTHTAHIHQDYTPRTHAPHQYPTAPTPPTTTATPLTYPQMHALSCPFVDRLWQIWNLASVVNSRC